MPVYCQTFVNERRRDAPTRIMPMQLGRHPMTPYEMTKPAVIASARYCRRSGPHIAHIAYEEATPPHIDLKKGPGHEFQ